MERGFKIYFVIWRLQRRKTDLTILKVVPDTDKGLNHGRNDRTNRTENERAKAFQMGFMVGHWHRCGLPNYFDN
jgi:hypothetical protein